MVTDALFQFVMRVAAPGDSLDSALQSLPEPPSLVIGGGKAARTMAGHVSRIFPHATGAVAAPPQHANTHLPIRLLPAGHPLPTMDSVYAVAEQERLLAAGGEGLVLFLLSGGASAMLGAPLSGLSLDDLRLGYQQLLGAGLSVQQMNVVRRHLTRWGGGKLAAKLRRNVIALVISDVLDDDLRAIGSGPLAGDDTTFADAFEILAGVSLAHTPIGLFCRAGIEGKYPETLRPGTPELAGVQHRIVLSNNTVLKRLHRALARYPVHVLSTQTGPVESVAADWAVRLRGAPGIYLAGGEPTVELHGGSGRGGRNQHLVLATGMRAAGADDWLFLSIATDGIDGNSENAGAWISPEIAVQNWEVLRNGIAAFDSAGVAEGLGIAFRSGPSGTNVADIQIGIAGVSRFPELQSDRIFDVDVAAGKPDA